jgi:hypothetical protein
MTERVRYFDCCWRRLVLAAVVLLPAAILVGQTQTTMPVLITHPTSTPSPTPEEKKVLEQLETALADAIQEQMPCVVPTTSADIKDKADEARRHALGSDGPNNDLANLASLVGARDIVSTGVHSMGGGKYSVDAAYMDARTTRTQMRNNDVVDGSDAALDSFAQKVAQGLRAQPRFANAGSCTAEREWGGVIRYSFHAEPVSSNPTKECTTKDIRSKEDWKYSIRIPAIGEPSAMVFMTRLVLETSECTKRVWCGTKGWANEVSNTNDTKQWIGAAPVKPQVSFDVTQGKLYLSVDLPPIPTAVTLEGDTQYHSECLTAPKPTKSSNQSTMPLFPRTGRVPPQVIAPGQKKLSGSAKDADGGITSWQLIRTNKK